MLCERSKLSGGDLHLQHQVKELSDPRNWEEFRMIGHKTLDDIEAGKIGLTNVDFDIRRAVDGSCELFLSEACNRQLPLMTFIDPVLPNEVHGDPEQIQQVLMNLINNAIKFSSSGGIIVRANIESVADRTLNVRFSVTDHGIGLTFAEQQRLFQSCVQMDGTLSRFGETGSGLNICKRLVELMGGKIGVSSCKGEGSTFWFSVPLEDRSKVTSISLRTELRGMRLLIVDSVPESCAILETYAAAWGMRCCSVTTARAALFLVRQAYYDGDFFPIAIISQALPDGNAFELSGEILLNKDFFETQLILLSDFNSPELETFVRDEGFKTYLTKPVTQARLLKSIIQVVSGKRSVTT